MEVMRYQVNIKIEYVEVKIRVPCNIQVLWKRGNNKCLVESKSNKNNRYLFNDELTLDFNVKDAKKTNLIVTLDNGSKLAGYAQFVISDQMSKKGRCQLPLEKSPDSQALISFQYEILDLGMTCQSSSKQSDSSRYIQESFGNTYERDHTLCGKENMISQNHMELQSVKNELNLHKDLYERCLKENDKLKEQLLQSKLANQSLIAQQEKQKSEYHQLETQQNNYKNEKEYLENHIAEHRLKIQSLEQQQIEQTTKYQSQLNELSLDNTQLKQKCSSLQNHCDVAETKVKQLSEDSLKLQQELQHYRKDVLKLKEENQLFQQKIYKMEEIIDEQNEEITIQSLQFMKELQIITRKQEQLSGL